jgi:cell division initiation protein
MDVTPQVINEVEFHQKMRGYDPDEVDDFLERVAVAVEQLQQRIQQAEQRAATAEQRAAERMKAAAAAAPAAPAPTPANEAEETDAIRRTLVLAQRTADAAIKEAEEEAKRTIASAQEQVKRLLSDTQDKARKLVADAEADARKASEDTRQRIVKEIVALEETRDALRADQGILERHLEEQRLRLRSSIGELQRVLDDPGRLRAVPPPELSGATRPDIEAAPARPQKTPSPADAPSGGDVIDLGGSSPAVDESPVQRPVTGSVTFTPPDESDPPAPGASLRTERSAGRVALADDRNADAWARFAKGDFDGPPTMAVKATESGEDTYMTELRKAMIDDTSASSMAPDEHRARARFGRRR